MQWASFPLSSSHSVKETIDLTEKEEKIFRLLEVIRHFGLDTQLRVCGDWVRDKKPEQSKHLETGVRVYDTWIDFVDLRSEKYVNSWSPTMVELIFYGLNFWIDMFKFISMYAKAKGLSGTKRYFGDLGKTVKMAGSNALFAALTEISDNVLIGAETNGFNGMVTGFHQGILRLAMEPTLLGAALLEGGPDRKIELVRSPGVDELYIDGYLQAMLDTRYQLEFLRVRVVDDLVYLKNLPPNTSVINEIVENVKSFLVSKNLLEGDGSTTSHPFRHLRSENEWRLGPAVLTLCEHLFVHYAVHILHQEASKFFVGVRSKTKKDGDEGESSEAGPEKHTRKQAVVKFVLSGIVAYMDGRLCRHIPNPIARRIVSGFLLSFLDQKSSK